MNHGDDAPGSTDNETTADEGFVQRWSRRKIDAEQVPEPTPPIEAQPADPPPEPESPGDEDMPPLDSIGQDSDVSEFFSPRVSEGLRQAALQRIFRQPRFNYQDGLDVYCGDYRHFKPLGEIVTAAMRHRLEVARQRLAQLRQQTELGADRTTVEPGDEPRPGRSIDAFDDSSEDSTDPSTDDNGHA